MSNQEPYTGKCRVIKYSPQQNAKYYDLCDPDDADAVVDIAGNEIEGHKELDALSRKLKPFMTGATVTIFNSGYEGPELPSPSRSYRAAKATCASPQIRANTKRCSSPAVPKLAGRC